MLNDSLGEGIRHCVVGGIGALPHLGSEYLWNFFFLSHGEIYRIAKTPQLIGVECIAVVKAIILQEWFSTAWV